MTAEGRAPGDGTDGEVVLRSHDLAKLAGTTPRALRHYHKVGLLPEAPRDPNGYRRYGPGDLVRVLRIRQFSASGMPLRKIGSVLEHDTTNLHRLLADLDHELEEQADRIAAQRRALADLRRLSVQTGRFSNAEQPTATQQLDHDVWTLVTATGGVDADTATAVLDVLHGDGLAEQVATWYPEFEQLEAQAHVDAVTVDRLVARMVSFADTVVEAAGFTPADDEHPVMALIEQMQAGALAPAQRDVWSAFLAVIEERWTGGPSLTEARDEPPDG